MLPTTFEHDADLRVSAQAIGIFAVAILAAGFSLTGLLTFAIRDPIFHADAVYLPSLTACIVGLANVFYSFIISHRYYWNVPAILTTVVAATSLCVYAGLLFYANRKKSRRQSHQSHQSLAPIITPPPAESTTSMETLVPRYQDPAYYDNYIANMFPASAHPSSQQASPQHPPQPSTQDLNSIPEEQMQRQQLLMLLMQNNSSPAHNASSSTFRIDWQGQDQEENAPAHGYYAPGTQSSSTGTGSSGYPISGISRAFSWESQRMRPWDGVWRDPMPAEMPSPGRIPQPTAAGTREERRRQIESGR
jgi:hypothetical protein